MKRHIKLFEEYTQNEIESQNLSKYDRLQDLIDKAEKITGDTYEDSMEAIAGLEANDSSETKGLIAAIRVLDDEIDDIDRNSYL